MKLALDGRHSRFCALFAEHCPTWAEFIDLGEDLEGSTYKDAQTGEVLPLPALDFARIKKIIMFSEAQVASEGIDNDPCNWTRDMWSEWRAHNHISSASSRSGKEIVFLKPDPDTLVSTLSKDVLLESPSKIAALNTRRARWKS